MLFNTLEFWAFFSLCFVLVLLGPRRLRNPILLVASYVFYASWDWRFLSLILFSTAVDYTVARALAAEGVPGRRRAWLWLSVATNLGLLGAFKYAGFFADSARTLALALGVELPPFALDVVLPVGISFYTFQTLGYTIDVYRGRLEPARSPVDFALFVAFFPQLVAGPIERASRFLPQILNPRPADWAGVRSGAWLALFGLFKKVVIADNLARLVDAVYAPGADPTSGEMWLAFYAFAFQIYCDFSGYTDIARGVARMLGFDLMVNFDRPYLSASPAEFWRRWHISLSTWLRDYLYIPLGGNRGSAGVVARNLLVTMALGGLWHGAAWTFIVWGGYHGLLLVAQRSLATRLAAWGGRLGRAARPLGVVVTFHLVCVGWVLFRADSLEGALRRLALLAAPLDPGLALQWLGPFAFLLAPLVLLEAMQSWARDPEVVLRSRVGVRIAVYASITAMIVLLGDDGGEAFLYFQF